MSKLLALIMLVGTGQTVFAAYKPFDKVFIIIFENESRQKVIDQPFFKKMVESGALLEKYYGVTHPSYPNYLALTSGSTWGVLTDRQKKLDVKHIGDALEAQGKTWKVYAEDYPGKCFLDSRSGKYARRHVPFLSYKNVQDSAERCARVVNASELKGDIEGGRLSDYTFYVPNNDNNGHDTNVTYADRWLEKTIGPLLKDPLFTKGMLLVLTFDEDDLFNRNNIYTVLWGEGVIPGSIAKARYDHYSLLRTIEDVFELDTLGQHDLKAPSIHDIWRAKWMSSKSIFRRKLKKNVSSK